MLTIALKEWAIVCELLLEGNLALLLRKGGIREANGPGEFELEHQRFLLFPAWMHQRPEMMKTEYRQRVQVTGHEPAEITFHGLGEVARIWRVPDRASFDRLEDLHCWTKPQIDMRFNYRPENPLYLMAIRASRLATSKTVTNIPAYAGCKSWVPLRAEDAVEDAAAELVLDEAEMRGIIARVNKAFDGR